MGAREAPGVSYGEEHAGLDDPGLPDFAAFCAARERFFRRLAGPAVRAEPHATDRGGRRHGSDEAPIGARRTA
jgi:hypothetical protein